MAGNLESTVSSTKTEKKTKKKKKSETVREAYEEASGVCTPSNPNWDSGVSPKVSHCPGLLNMKLCSNSDINVDFTSSSSIGSDDLVVTVELCVSVTGRRRLKDIEANVVDTMYVQMVRDKPGSLLRTTLAPGETGELRLYLAVGSIRFHKLFAER
ncbi:hypothetical protein KIN20_000747 [Parelaphostrongylus tenuis]|uniref:Uncharacterized protein n=1 Tax=Parelaphostrongylus tenuis TaxID=148309 RepID=A0AAD5QBR6_PARTN|nr:hypothetical protein KIN20_000747 [Parelaphostrongylus tenuis]